MIAGYQARIEAVPGLESEWISLSRDYDTLQANYEQLLAKSEDSKVAANLERRQIGEQFRVLDPARVPERPVSPNRIQINGMGAALGLWHRARLDRPAWSTATPASTPTWTS